VVGRVEIRCNCSVSKLSMEEGREVEREEGWRRRWKLTVCATRFVPLPQSPSTEKNGQAPSLIYSFPPGERLRTFNLPFRPLPLLLPPKNSPLLSSPPSPSFSPRPSSNPPPTPRSSTSSSTQPPPSQISLSLTPKEQKIEILIDAVDSKWRGPQSSSRARRVERVCFSSR